MIRIEAGPVAITALIVLIVALCAGVTWLFFWWKQRPYRMLHKKIIQIGEFEPILNEVRRLLDKDKKEIDRFIGDFAREVGHHFAGEPWTAKVTLHDIRNHVEVAVFELVKGCSCGGCPGVSNGGPFWIEAWRTDQGLFLNGMIAMSVAITGGPDREAMLKVSVQPGANVTMMCVKCQGPVTTSIEHLSEGKKPLCAVCIGKETANG